jgi:CRISPR-associated protein Csm5
MAKKFYTLTPVTGVHIGTGEELSPLDYKIAPNIGDKYIKEKESVYWKLSSDRILYRLCKDDKAMSAFERASVEGNIKELYKFFQENCTHIEDTDYFCEITKNFLKLYNENQKKDPLQNAAKVWQMYHTEGKPNPVIPGSSIKGSVRTALLNNYLLGLSDGEYESLHKKFEQEKETGKFDSRMQKELLGYKDKDAKNDPFRAVLFSDCFFKYADTQLAGGLDMVSVNKKTGNLESIGTQIQAEVIRGELLEGKAASELSITINDMLQKTPFSLQREGQPKCIKTITFEDIRKSCNEFYWGEFQNEYDKFYKDASDGSEKLIVKLKGKLEAAVKNPKQFIIRVGRWSQVEFVTFDDNFRKPLTKKDKFGKPLGYGGTRTLFDYDGKYAPLGWCILEAKEA